MRNLDFLEVIDPDLTVVALAREKHLDKVRDDPQLDEVARVVERLHRNGFVRLALEFAAGHVVLIPDAPGHVRIRKAIERAAHVAAGIAVLRTPRQQLIKRRA